jgi:hypothetical protein
MRAMARIGLGKWTAAERRSLCGGDRPTQSLAQNRHEIRRSADRWTKLVFTNKGLFIPKHIEFAFMIDLFVKSCQAPFARYMTSRHEF